jgi:hypothetical protein
MKLIRYAAIIFFMCSLGTVARSQAINLSEMLVLEDGEVLPDSARLIDDIKIGGSLRGGCGYSDALLRAKEKARDKGGNVLRITDVRFPDGLATCVRLRGEVYSAPRITDLVQKKKHAWDSTRNAMLPDTASYALLYVYRPMNGKGGLISYNLHVDDSMVCRVTNGSRSVIKLPHTGETHIWARTEARKELPLIVKPGKVYFLKCEVNMGVMVGHPQFAFVDDYDGYIEYTQGNFHDDK